MIGDQIVTDIYGGNRMGIFTVLIKPMTKNEPIWTKCNRVRENYIIKKLIGYFELEVGPYRNLINLMKSLLICLNM